MTCQEVSQEIAVALLTHSELSPDVSLHIVGCPGCRVEWDRLAVLPALLDRARDIALAPAVAPPPAMLARLLVEASRYRRRRMAALVGSAAAVALVATSVGLVVAQGDHGRNLATSPPATSTRSVPGSSPTPSMPNPKSTGTDFNRAIGARLDVAVHDAAWGDAGNGSNLMITVTGIPAGTRCALYLTDHNGNREWAGDWRVDSSGSHTWPEKYAEPPSEIAVAEVVDDSTGVTLLSAPLHTTSS